MFTADNTSKCNDHYHFLDSNRVFLLAVGHAINVGIHYRIMIPHWVYMGISALKTGQSVKQTNGLLDRLSSFECTSAHVNPMGNY